MTVMSDIQFIPPDQCKNCGWMPAVRADEKQVIKTENSWLITTLPGSVLALYVCPACTCIHANKNIVENVEELREMKKKRIIGPPSQDMAKVLTGTN